MIDLPAAWRRAIVLVAGKGVRLKPRTDAVPKPLTEVNGVTILQNTLQRLSEFGVREVYLVTGHLRDVLMAHARHHAHGLELREIYNPIYATTNNMYSLWLAADILRHGCLLIEGDVFFDENILPSLQAAPAQFSYWLGDDFSQYGEGCRLTTDGDGTIVALKIVRGETRSEPGHHFKSVGILALQPELGEKLAGWLEEDVTVGRTDVYYDLVIGDRLPAPDLRILDIRGRKWMEIDDFQDLERAERLFMRPV